ncbi:MAG: Prolyl-tRNA synthetase [Candidatus Gottesmanbacteria bacterium GW2011_GWA2_41_12]|uniref:Proline--tRNA ligase n=2 Tax=Candidatus Gottesmaniibacteriota TaxID=1752720 RepID=A0A0G0UHL3_9BACT|nr:MAG: Prolyl-tRNA synthetase [Candidatus Gottesmanbacteria bacterium GW2011_GWC2_39_8]KKR88324.1 MAG: Prolyl-tRNA synthetase [Candidatus Gottesmanbacteria bacterium GW2011_GWA2_41_12]
MLYSKLFPKTRKDVPQGAESINHQLLVRAGFIDQLMAGSWTLLPLGWRVVTKINNIIREELNKIDAEEMLMPLMHPKEIWNETGRWDKASDIMYKLKDQHEKEYALSFTHEEIVMDLLRKFIKSYKDLPVSIYHFSTKFRNEPRARSGILRGREFMMKDQYSAHVSEEDMMNYYQKVKEAYLKIFARLGFKVRVTEASGGVFTDKHTHEFQVLSDSGEDTIYFCDKCEWGANQEIFSGKEGDLCPSCKEGKIVSSKSIEVGNIFPLGTFYSEKMRATYTDEKGERKPLWFGSYGIGPTRVMGTIVEVSHDDRGIIWFPQIAPFSVHLISLKGAEARGEEIYNKLLEKNIEVLWDDRDESPGVKFSDADLIGIPVRLVVSQRTGEKIEFKRRTEKESQLLELVEVEKILSSRM